MRILSAFGLGLYKPNAVALNIVTSILAVAACVAPDVQLSGNLPAIPRRLPPIAIGAVKAPVKERMAIIAEVGVGGRIAISLISSIASSPIILGP